jgi:dihydroceramidase
MKHHSVLTGFWCPHTSTLDWCEENYVVTRYIAEFYNATSSLIFPLLAVYAGYHNYKAVKLPKRFITSFFILGLVGIGSALFHGTLKYSMQLADELPMIYGASQQLFCVVPYYFAGILLSLICILFTWYYIFINRNPSFHHALFTILELSFAVIIYYKISKLNNKREALKLLGNGISITLFAAILWSIDNNYCHYLKQFRQVMNRVYSGPFLEFHAWWHILSSFGVLWLLSCCFVVYYEQQGNQIEIKYLFYCVPLLNFKSKYIKLI